MVDADRCVGTEVVKPVGRWILCAANRTFAFDDRIAGSMGSFGIRMRAVSYLLALLINTLFCLAAFAQDFGISAATLRRRFIAATGLPPKALQLRLRIDRAKELLATTDAPIEQIARTVGFEDSFYFARLFLGRESLTPSEFRRRHQRH